MEVDELLALGLGCIDQVRLVAGFTKCSLIISLSCIAVGTMVIRVVNESLEVLNFD